MVILNGPVIRPIWYDCRTERRRVNLLISLNAYVGKTASV